MCITHSQIGNGLMCHVMPHINTAAELASVVDAGRETGQQEEGNEKGGRRHQSGTRGEGWFVDIQSSTKTAMYALTCTSDYIPR